MTSRFVNRAGLVAALVASFLVATTQVQLAQQSAQQPAAAAAAGRRRSGPSAAHRSILRGQRISKIRCLD